MVFTIFVVPVLLKLNIFDIRLLHVMTLTIFFVGIWSASSKPLLYISLILFGVHFILKLIRFSDGPFEFEVLEKVVSALNVLVFIFINFRLLFRDGDINFERVLGAINVYLLIAFLGALMLDLTHQLTGQSLGGSVKLTGTEADYVEYIYFSLVSITTVGYGDVYPLGHAAKMLSVGISALGVLYPAVVIARLVSAAVPSNRKNRI